jgi:prepilin signal peptidase PulO-like enzyme (type II secretory pathway)
MLDHGVLGAAIMPLLILALIWRAQGETRRVGLIFGATILWLSFLTHTMLNFGPNLILFPLLAAMVLTESFRVHDATQATTADKAALNKALSGV